MRGNTATSPPIKITQGHKKFSLLWRLQNAGRSRGEFFRVFVIDHKGGRKMILNQTTQDIAEVANYDQLFEDDFRRYVGPPIRIMLETSPGLSARVEQLTH